VIRWFDYLLAFLAAGYMAYAFFSIPIIGAFVAWGIYEMWNHIYIPWRYNQEYGE
jgi:mannitol-specific phosphotransferase system IIBC component